MLRITKQADYAIVLLIYMGLHPDHLHNARGLAVKAHIPQPMVSKILKALARGGILTSQRGSRGGYQFARPSGQIRISEVINALEGPVAITECADGHCACIVESTCPARSSWQRINQVVNRALEGITLHELICGPEKNTNPDVPCACHLGAVHPTSALTEVSQ